MTINEEYKNIVTELSSRIDRLEKKWMNLDERFEYFVTKHYGFESISKEQRDDALFMLEIEK